MRKKKLFILIDVFKKKLKALNKMIKFVIFVQKLALEWILTLNSKIKRIDASFEIIENMIVFIKNHTRDM